MNCPICGRKVNRVGVFAEGSVPTSVYFGHDIDPPYVVCQRDPPNVVTDWPPYPDLNLVESLPVEPDAAEPHYEQWEASTPLTRQERAAREGE